MAIDQTIPVAAQPTGGQAFALTPNGRIPDSVLQRTHAYRDYTPTWTASGTAPAVGNAVVVARYAQVGKLVHAYGKLVFGSTSTFGTGSYAFTLPTNTGTVIAANPLLIGTIILYDDSSGNAIVSPVIAASASTMNFQYPATYGGTLTPVGQLAPWTWAVSDILDWNLTYEAA